MVTSWPMRRYKIILTANYYKYIYYSIWAFISDSKFPLYSNLCQKILHRNEDFTICALLPILPLPSSIGTGLNWKNLHWVNNSKIWDFKSCFNNRIICILQNLQCSNSIGNIVFIFSKNFLRAWRCGKNGKRKWEKFIWN